LQTEQTIKKLAAQLEELRLETQDVESIITQTEEEGETTKQTLIVERDAARQQHKGKEDISSELRREVATLERQSRTIQSRKAAKENLLREKENQRKKRINEAQRWEDEIAEVDIKVEQLEKDKKDIAKSVEAKVKSIKSGISDQQDGIKSLEAEVRQRGIEIKQLEEERKTLVCGDEDDEEKERENLEAEKERQWDQRYQELHAKYLAECRSWEQAYNNYQQAQEQLMWWQSRRGSDSTSLHGVSLDTDGSLKRSKSRRNRQRKSRASAAGSFGALPLYDSRFPGTTTFDSFSTSSPVFSNPTPASPHLPNLNSFPTHLSDTITAEEIDKLTAGAPMSPQANALLPSNLLGDEESQSPESLLHPIESIGYPAYGQYEVFGHDSFFPAPISPTSSDSRSPSHFSSPRSSSQQISLFPSMPEALNDPDRISLRSVGSGLGGVIGSPDSTHSGGSRRFANLFSFRQRGKTLQEGSPMLGDLRDAESQSVPRDLTDPALDPIGTRRRSGSHSGHWVSPVHLRFRNRNNPVTTEVTEGNGPVPARTPVRKAGPFNIFGSRLDQSVDPSRLLDGLSSRPASISSLDHPQLPRPSSNTSPFGWPTTDPIRPRPGSMDGDWLSMFPGRRADHKTNSSLSVLSASSPLAAPATPAQAPIGTRPNSYVFSGSNPQDQNASQMTGKLNPAAPTFKIFGRNESKKAENTGSSAPALHLPIDDSIIPAGPPSSRDSHSFRAPSIDDNIARSSLDRSESSMLMDESLHGASSSVSGSINKDTKDKDKDKESFISKITRKSSSSKFNISNHWKEKGGLFSSSSKKQNLSSSSSSAAIGTANTSGSALGFAEPHSSEAEEDDARSSSHYADSLLSPALISGGSVGSSSVHGASSIGAGPGNISGSVNGDVLSSPLASAPSTPNPALSTSGGFGAVGPSVSTTGTPASAISVSTSFQSSTVSVDPATPTAENVNSTTPGSHGQQSKTRGWGLMGRNKKKGVANAGNSASEVNSPVAVKPGDSEDDAVGFGHD
jgi:hypothetical protein